MIFHLVPEQSGGKDIERARLEGPAYVQPTQESMLATTSEFLDQVHASNNCNVFGISLGGAVAYYLHNKRPDKIQRAMLVCPAIPACVDKDLAKDSQWNEQLLLLRISQRCQTTIP